jgi:ABC-type sulfate/molybdate transport systems ATPase subunit
VLFDGVASTFTISRGSGLRTKKEEFGATRVQVLHDRGKQVAIWHILAYFEDGQAMCFTVDPNDALEKSNSKGKFGLKLTDASFRLPSEGETDERRKFLCIENVVEPDEQEDIVVVFENEETRDRLAQVLPGSVKEASSLRGTLRLKK